LVKVVEMVNWLNWNRKNKMKIKLLILLIIIYTNITFGQMHDHHHHSDYEFGISLGVATLVEEEEYSPSAHLHLLRKLGDHDLLSKISLGLGYEIIFSEHTHNSVVGTISINPFSAWKIDISPGILFAEHEGEKEQHFVAHFELMYDIHFHGFGVGPVIGYGWSKEDQHLMAGLHFGIEF